MLDEVKGDILAAAAAAAALARDLEVPSSTLLASGADAAACPRPTTWCTHVGATNEFKECGGVPGHWCSDIYGQTGFSPCTCDNRGPTEKEPGDCASWAAIGEPVRRTGLEPQPSRLKIDLPLSRASPVLDRACSAWRRILAGLHRMAPAVVTEPQPPPTLPLRVAERWAQIAGKGVAKRQGDAASRTLETQVARPAPSRQMRLPLPRVSTARNRARGGRIRGCRIGRRQRS